MTDKAVLCYISSWSHGSLHRCSLVGDLVPSSGEGVWLVDTVVLPMGMHIPSPPSVLPLPLPLGSPGSVQWLAVSIHICIGQALAEPLRGQPYQAPVSKHFLASTILSRFGNCIWDESPVGRVPGWPFLQFCSTLCLHICSCEYFVLHLRRTKAPIL